MRAWIQPPSTAPIKQQVESSARNANQVPIIVFAGEWHPIKPRSQIGASSVSHYVTEMTDYSEFTASFHVFRYFNRPEEKKLMKQLMPRNFRTEKASHVRTDKPASPNPLEFAFWMKAELLDLLKDTVLS